MTKLSEHKETPQALMAADALTENPLFLGYTLEYSPICGPGMPFPYRCTFLSACVLPREWGRYKHSGLGSTLAKAIYQAIDKAKDALQEEQDAETE